MDLFTKAEECSSLGMDYINRKNYKEAISIFSAEIKLLELILKEGGNDMAFLVNKMISGAYSNRALAKSHIKKYEEAVNDYNKSLKLNTEDAIAYLNRGMCLGCLKKYDAAIEDATKAILINPENHEICIAYYNRGVSKYGKGDINGAIDDYSEAIKLNPNESAYYGNRASASLKLEIKYYERIHADYKKAFELNSENIIYQTLMESTGIQWLSQKIEHLNKLIKKNNKDANLYFERGKLKTSKIEHLNKLIKKSNKDDYEDNYEDVLEDYNKSIELNPRNALVYHARGQTKEAIESREVLGGAFSNYESILNDYNKAIELNPDNEQVYFDRGIINIVNNKKKEGFYDLRKACKLGHPDAQKTIKKYLPKNILKRIYNRIIWSFQKS